MNRRDLMASLGALGLTGAAGAKDPQPRHVGTSPMSTPHAHFCGIHMAKNNPKFQFTTQHYCCAQGDGLHQCLLYDSTKPDAKLIGIEYIVTDEIYRKLPTEEKQYWHPHTYEVLGGGLVAPAMSDEEEHKFMSYILTTWGKAWHTWPDPSTAVPLGPPLLIWSLMADGQVDPKVVAARDKEFAMSTEGVRRKRAGKFNMEVPNVSFPKSMDAIGRQWTDSGEDKPRKRG